ncbi:protein of unknown function [Georgfuchsia toluolica]|uniref:Phosphoribosyltransferase domain-containing protein n=2 Tax=Georgfuchsia toluolica TaxID=424218 RepID=A0A916J5L8_9PROT|nr:protein of unknown function [Georgfuchsia toluolica]
MTKLFSRSDPGGDGAGNIVVIFDKFQGAKNEHTEKIIGKSFVSCTQVKQEMKMIFDDRAAAARLLARALDSYLGRNPLILAIPRGAVPMGEILAKQLQGELDVVLVRKLRAPGNPEFAIGAVAESGWREVEDYAASTGADEGYLRREIETQRANIRERREMLKDVAPSLDPAGRIAIVVDDGLATGATMVTALQAVRDRKPARLVCAVPVASGEALARVTALADEVVCLHRPLAFYAVGQFYASFKQVEDAEVIECLRRARMAPG